MCAGLIVIAYFLPWLDIMFASMSGFVFGKMVLTEAGKSGGPGWAYATLFCRAGNRVSGYEPKKRTYCFRAIRLVNSCMDSDRGGRWSYWIQVVGIGLWITLAAAIGQIVGAFMLEESPAGDSVESGETAEE